MATLGLNFDSSAFCIVLMQWDIALNTTGKKQIKFGILWVFASSKINFSVEQGNRKWSMKFVSDSPQKPSVKVV